MENGPIKQMKQTIAIREEKKCRYECLCISDTLGSHFTL